MPRRRDEQNFSACLAEFLGKRNARTILSRLINRTLLVNIPFSSWLLSETSTLVSNVSLAAFVLNELLEVWRTGRRGKEAKLTQMLEIGDLLERLEINEKWDGLLKMNEWRSEAESLAQYTHLHSIHLSNLIQKSHTTVRKCTNSGVSILYLIRLLAWTIEKICDQAGVRLKSDRLQSVRKQFKKYKRSSSGFNSLTNFPAALISLAPNWNRW